MAKIPWRKQLERMGVKSIGSYVTKEGTEIAIHSDSEAMYDAARLYLESIGLKVL